MSCPDIWRVYVVIGLAGYTVHPHPLSCSVWKRGVGWRKASTLAGKIWQTHNGGLGWRQDNNETIQVLKKCLLKQSVLVKEGTNKKTADRRIRCRCGTWKCWTCQTIFSCPLFFCIAYFCRCYKQGKHNKISVLAWGKIWKNLATYATFFRCNHFKRWIMTW